MVEANRFFLRERPSWNYANFNMFSPQLFRYCLVASDIYPKEGRRQTNTKPLNITHKLVSILFYTQESILKFQICIFYVTETVSLQLLEYLLYPLQPSWELCSAFFCILIMRKLKHTVAITSIICHLSRKRSEVQNPSFDTETVISKKKSSFISRTMTPISIYLLDTLYMCS